MFYYDLIGKKVNKVKNISNIIEFKNELIIFIDAVEQINYFLLFSFSKLRIRSGLFIIINVNDSILNDIKKNKLIHNEFISFGNMIFIQNLQKSNFLFTAQGGSTQIRITKKWLMSI